MYTFSTSIEKVCKINKYLTDKLSSLNIFTAGDLLYYLPHRYEDFSAVKKINEINLAEKITTKGVVKEIKTIRTWRKKMTITEAHIEDETGVIKAVWFNYPLPVKFLSKGKYVQISGQIKLTKKNEPYFQHPNFELISKVQYESAELDNGGDNKINDGNNNLIDKNSGHNKKGIATGSLISIYPETRGVTSYWLRRIIKKVLDQTEIEEFIPQDILKSQNLINLKSALKKIHFPENNKQADVAKKRLAFEKMFLIQLKSLQIKKNFQNRSARPIKFNQKLVQNFVHSLAFNLTDAQKKAAWQIIKDLEKDIPMNRLLEGDVGSGKTVVAAMALFSTISKKNQAVFLSPTEVLATQHYQSVFKLFKKYNFRIALLTASQKKINDEKISKKIFLNKLANGKIDLIIGTHAILQDKVIFKNLALVVVDEQHRFGVNQRAFLQQKTASLDDDNNKKTVPHLLTMTATPIPRSLSLAIFGNLDLSIIDEMPKGRKNIITKVIKKEGREQVYQFIKKEIQAGRQTFIICPLVEESSKISEVKAATEEFERLQKDIFPEFKLGLLHGRIKPLEKNKIMENFKNKKIDILVSTSVVEVGVDIPNATIMLIEGAERFGLSQLHQFRGRVGRSEFQSYCFLFTSKNAPDSTSRLRVMEKTNNGFKIAQEDLRLRGPGQFLGTLQSGLPDVAMESLADVKSIQAARLEAQRIIAFDSELKKFPLLKKELQKMENFTHWE